MNRKNLFKSTLALFLIFSFSFTTDDCNPFFPIHKGDVWVYESFDKKGKLQGTETTEVLDVEVKGEQVIFKMKGITDGPKGKEKNHHEMEMDYICENGVLKLNMDGMIPQETMDGMKDMEVEITQDRLIIPSEMKVGDELEDASVNMKASTNGMQVMNMTVMMKNRKVEKMEEVTTDAGTFNCVVVYQDVITDMGIMKRESSSRDWYSPKVGVVKSETYDKNGNKDYSRILKRYTAGS